MMPLSLLQSIQYSLEWLPVTVQTPFKECMKKRGGGGQGEGRGKELHLKHELYDIIFRSRLNGNFSLQRSATISFVTLSTWSLFFFNLYSFPFHSLMWKQSFLCVNITGKKQVVIFLIKMEEPISGHVGFNFTSETYQQVLLCQH